jgi:hypothetical protein
MSKFTDKPTKDNEFMIDTMLKQKIEQWAPTFASYLIHVYNTQYKNKTYLEDPEEVMASTKQYKSENDFYTEYINDRITVTTNTKDIIGQDTMWEDFRAWFKSEHEQDKLPRKPELMKMMVKFLGGDINKKYFNNIVFNPKKEQTPHVTHDDVPKCELDV